MSARRDDVRRVGERLRLLREHAQRPVPVVAALLGVSDKAVYAYETGQNLIDGIRAGQLAEFYGVSLDYIFRGIPESLPDELVGR